MNKQKIINYIEKRKAEIEAMLVLDREIKADPYDNVARLIEVEKFEKVFMKK